MPRRSIGSPRLFGACLGLLAAALLLLSSEPAAAIDWLVLVVDRSKSIDEKELALQRDAYVRLLTDPSVSQALNGAKVAIVEFDTRPEVVVDWANPKDAALRYQHRSPDGLRGQTGIGEAIATALGLLADKSGRLVIDVSGDGKDNVNPSLLAEARAFAEQRAIEINGLAITDRTPEIDRYYRQSVVNGFVLPVGRQDDFFSALKAKLFYEVAGVWPNRLASRHGPQMAWGGRQPP